MCLYKVISFIFQSNSLPFYEIQYIHTITFLFFKLHLFICLLVVTNILLQKQSICTEQRVFL